MVPGWPWTKDPEDAPIGGPDSEPSADAARRPHTLTPELLDWGTAALEAVMTTEAFSDAPKRVQTAIADGYKYLDRLYPLTLEKRE